MSNKNKIVSVNLEKQTICCFSSGSRYVSSDFKLSKSMLTTNSKI